MEEAITTSLKHKNVDLDAPYFSDVKYDRKHNCIYLGKPAETASYGSSL
jgi:hypothetical protein